MESVYNLLVRPAEQMILLFTPPFDKTPHDPGYIKGYLPGVRENGGQYTHAAIWVVRAFAELGQGDRAVALFHLLNPIGHADTPEKMARYQVEPYVIAADIYSQPLPFWRRRLDVVYRLFQLDVRFGHRSHPGHFPLRGYAQNQSLYFPSLAWI